MDSYYEGTTEGRITVDIGIDVTTITSADIYYRKPDWTVGHFTGTFTTGTEVYYDILADTDIPVGSYGLWTFWAKIIFPDGDFTTTTPFTVKVVRVGYGGCS